MSACTVPVGSYNFSALLLGVKDYLPLSSTCSDPLIKRTAGAVPALQKGEKHYMMEGLKKKTPHD